MSLQTYETELPAAEPMVFDFTGTSQMVTLNPGTYQIECWGAKGGGGMKDSVLIPITAQGGYSKGKIELRDTATLYLYVGGKGANGKAAGKTNAAAGWNGGGVGGSDIGDDGAGAGGGASDIRLLGGEWNDPQSLRSRIMVAGGSSGESYYYPGLSGGGLSGGSSTVKGGSQTAGFAFGVGENGKNTSADSTPSGGAGGGYYGGYSAPLSNNKVTASSGGGSGFISGHPGCDAVTEDGVHTGQPVHYSGLYFTDTLMENGADPGTDNGRIIITPLEPDLFVLLDIGEQAQLSMFHDLLKNTDFTWSTTNPLAAAVDAAGIVTGIAEGTSYIWSESSDGSYKDYIPVIVMKNAEEMRLALHLNVGETKCLWFGNDPASVIWSPMDPAVAMVDNTGRVTAVSRGLCIVKAELNGIEKYLYVRVND